MSQIPKYGQIWIYTEENPPKLLVYGYIGDGQINITGGGGGWESVAIPQDSPVSVWRGSQNVYEIEIPIMFDTYDKIVGNTVIDGKVVYQNYDVESQCRTLEQMYGALTNPVTEPPLLIINAAGAIPNDVYNFPPLRWVISEEPQWGEQLRNDQGRRTRQAVTVKFMKYSPYDAIGKGASAKGAQPAHTTIAKANETYNKIAARALKNSGGVRWGNRLAQLNGAKDGAALARAGVFVKLPTAAQLNAWKHSSRR